MQEDATVESGRLAGRREWTGLAVLALPTLLVSLDMSVLYLALPGLAADLKPNSAQLLWITDIYGFMVAGLLITMGTLGDRIGRRRLLMIGASAFGVASVLAAYAPTTETLIAARALLGIAGATLMPSTLALISNMFKDAAQRGMAIALWMSCFMAGIAIGPLVGGVLLEFFWWGSVFLVGVPVMLVLLVAAPQLLPEYRDTAAGRLDPLSVALSLAAILPIVYGFKELAKEGFGAAPLVAMAVGLAFGAVFLRRQRWLTSPLLDLRLIGGRTGAALLVLLLGSATVGGISMFVTQHLQMVEGLSPLRAGLWLLAPALGMIISAMSAPALAERFGPGRVVGAGFAIMAAGYLTLALAGPPSSLAVILIGFIVVYFGSGPFGALGTDLVVGSAPPEKAGSVSALSETCTELGVALGVAALGSVGTAVYRDQIAGAIPDGTPAEAASAAGDTLAGAIEATRALPAELGAALLQPARDAFTQGLSAAAWVSCAAVVGLAVLAVLMLRHVRPTTDSAEEAPQQHSEMHDQHATKA